MICIFRFMERFNESTCIPINLETIQVLSKFEPKYDTCTSPSSKSIMNCWGLVNVLKNQCKNPCEEIEYFGRTHKWLDYETPDVLTLNIRFVSNEVKVQEQYFIYSTVDLIGIIGGNLGLFIGFSFFDKFKQMISFITNRLQN